jgi:type 1 fimbriae regulatory protein FimB/type 1 fimbriae regulatory protein FimE
MSKIVELPQASFSGKFRKPPRKPRNAEVRSREYLTPREVEKLMAAARKIGRHGHRDRTLILVMYRHGLRVSELVRLRWDQVDLDAGLIHVNRMKNGIPSSHPLGGLEIRR